MPDWPSLVGTFGPVGALVAYMILQDRKAVKTDPIKALTDEFADLRERMVRVETLLEQVVKK